MPKLSVSALTISDLGQKTANIIFLGSVEPEPPIVDTFFIITDNNEILTTDDSSELIYGT